MTPEEWIADVGPVIWDRVVVGVSLVSPDGFFVSPNKAYQVILERTSHELEALTFMDVTHPQDVGNDTAEAQSVRSGVLEGYEMVKRYKMKRPGRDGNPVYKWVRIYVSALRDPSSQVLEFFLVQCVALRSDYSVGTMVPTTPSAPTHVRVGMWVRENWQVVLWLLSGIAALFGWALNGPPGGGE